jgi:putative transposase
MTISTEIIDQILGNAKTEEDLFGKHGLLKQLSKQLMERILEAELTNHLGYEKQGKQSSPDNYRNGKRCKKVKTGNGEVIIDVPRDRAGDFEPVLIPKRQRRLSGMDEKVLALYAKGMTVRDIQSFLEELYNTEISKDLISNITDSILDELNDWRNRPLDRLYPIVYIDGFVTKCRLDGRVCNRTVYIVYGITIEGYKEVLGLYLGENESAKYWLTVLTNLKNRGIEDIFLICADGLKGLPESVESAFPKTIFQTCIVHMVRNSLNYVPYKEKKAVAEDLKKIYQADTVELAESALDDFELTWGGKYSAIVKSWRNNWDKIIPFFDFPKDIRKVIYTTNIIESLNRTLRKSVKNRGQFPTEDSLMKVLYLAIRGVSKKWTMPIRDWTGALNQFAIVFEDRFSKDLVIN